MSAPQNTIAIVYDYDQTLSPSYMQDEVVFPAFGINSEIFWRRCSELVRDHGYDNELAYMKVLLDQLGMDRPTNEELKKLGAKLNFYQGLPEMFEEFRGGEGLLTTEHVAHGITVEHYIISSGMKVLIDGSRLAPYVRAIFGCELSQFLFCGGDKLLRAENQRIGAGEIRHGDRLHDVEERDRGVELLRERRRIGKGLERGFREIGGNED